MTWIAIATSCLLEDLRRYSRSRGLWVLILIIPIGAEFLVEGSTVHIAVHRHLLVMSSATIGITIGIVVSTMLLPLGFLYLRSNVTRSRAWQIEDVTPAPRSAVVMGHFLADCTVLLGALGIGTIAGWVLAWRTNQGAFDLVQLTRATWLIACPSLIWVAALRHLLNTTALTRGAFGDVLAFACWMATLVMPALAAERPSSLAVNMHDLTGYVRPIIGGSPLQGQDFAVGGGPVLPGRHLLDAEAGLGARGYVGSRFVWLGLGLLAAVIAGVLDQQRRPNSRKIRAPRLQIWVGSLRGPPRPISNSPARHSPWRICSVAAAEFRLIGQRPWFKILAILSACVGLAGDYRHVGSPAALLLLSFGLSEQAGRMEARRLSDLMATTPTSPAMRRTAFVAAGMTWAAVLAVPRAVVAAEPAPLLLAVMTGAASSAIAVILALATRTAFAPRMVLLILWYAYFAS